jgi:hypothetical protein
MKKIILCLVVVSTIFASCKKETKDVSKVYDANASKLELIGDPIYAPPAGTTTYSDPGATFTDDDGSKTVITTPLSLPDLSTPGFYSVSFKVTSMHGYVRTATRLVLVSKVDPSVDLSGTYLRPGQGTAIITKLGPGLYKTNNVGGVLNRPEFIFDVYFGQVDATTLVVPTQPNPLGGDLYCNQTSLSKTGSKYTIMWAVLGSGFGTQVRTFVQQ